MSDKVGPAMPDIPAAVARLLADPEVAAWISYLYRRAAEEQC